MPADPNGFYRVGGNTIRPSTPFRLPRQSGQVVIEAEVGSNVKHFVGLGVGIGGVVVAAYGALYWAFGQAVSSDGTKESADFGHSVSVVGVVLMVAGVVMGVVGVSLWNTHTSVDVH